MFKFYQNWPVTARCKDANLVLRKGANAVTLSILTGSVHVADIPVRFAFGMCSQHLRISHVRHPSLTPPHKKKYRPTADFICGEGEIRTPEELSPLPVFETGAFDHSATSPGATHTKRDRALERVRPPDAGLAMLDIGAPFGPDEEQN